MATRHVVARVVHGDNVLEPALRRPVRLTPDGCAGVVYAGSVFPLHDGDVADTAGPSWEIADCNRFLLADADLPYAPRLASASPKDADGFAGSWRLDTTELGHYVVFDADERTAGGVIELLEAGGLPVQRWDVSHRPAGDGRFYDWFARLRGKMPHDEAMRRVEDAFTGLRSVAQSVAIPLAPTTEDLEARIEALLTQNLDLQGRLADAAVEEQRLRSRLAAADQREAGLAKDLDRALEHHASLIEQIHQLRSSTEQDAAYASLLNDHMATEEFLELALAENAELWRGLKDSQDTSHEREQEVLVLKATLEEVRDRLAEVQEREREQRRAQVSRSAPRMGLEGFLGVAFARLELLQDSAEVLANLESPGAVLRCLVQIDMGEMLGRDLEGYRGWREISKLATGIAGSEDMGRIYYKPDGGRVLVCVHVKQDEKEQRRYLQRLQSL